MITNEKIINGLIAFKAERKWQPYNALHAKYRQLEIQNMREFFVVGSKFFLLNKNSTKIVDYKNLLPKLLNKNEK